MELTVLVDNNTYIDRYFIGEPALSFFIEDEGVRILFDTGYSDAFLKNAAKMDIQLRQLDFVALSHGHVDHTWGLTHLIRLFMEAKNEQLPHRVPRVIGHPQVFQSKLLAPVGEIGSLLTEDKLAHHFPITFSETPIWLTESLVFLGEIPRTNDFEGTETIGQVVTAQGRVADNVLDDSALVYNSSRGLVIIVGCAHAGICNIVEYAKKVCQDERIVDIIGGFHLLNATPEQLDKTVRYLQQAQPSQLHACHCTDLEAKIALSQVAPLVEVGVGLKVTY